LITLLKRYNNYKIMAWAFFLISSLLFQLALQAITPPTRPPSTTSEILTTKADAEVWEEKEGDMRGTLPGDFVTTAQPPSDFSSDNMGASEPEPVASAGASGTNPKSNLAAQPDSYSMFQHLMEAQVSLTQPSEEEPPQVKTLKSALKTFLETAWHGFYYGFMPEVARHRRSVGDEERSHLDTAITFMGAFFGMQNCSKVVACRAGRMAAEKVSGAAVFVMMAESFVPRGLKSWFTMVKTGVMGRDEDCSDGLRCSINDGD